MGDFISGIAGLVGGQPSYNAPTFDPINLNASDPNSLQALGAQTAQQNLSGGLALEQQYLPSLYQGTMAGQAQQANNISSISQLQPLANQAAGVLSNNVNTTAPTLALPALGANPVQNQTNNLVSANLQNPGQLPQDVQNQVARAAAASAGQAGLAGSPASGGIADASLGLNSLQLLNNNIAQGNQIGQQQQAANLSQQQAAAQMAQVNAALQQNQQSLDNSTSAALDAIISPLNAQLSQVTSTPLPVAGLNPNTVASASEANTAAQNSYNQQTSAAAAQQANLNAYNTAQDWGGIFSIGNFTGGGQSAVPSTSSASTNTSSGGSGASGLASLIGVLAAL